MGRQNLVVVRDGEDEQTLYPIIEVRWGTHNEWIQQVSEQVEWSEMLRSEVIALNAARLRRQMIIDEIEEMELKLS